jgi:hypothetical protein
VFEDPLIRLLTSLQKAADGQGIESPMTWTAINSALRGDGVPTVKYSTFSARWEKEPILKQLVDRFDGNGLQVKTAAKDQPEQGKKKTNAMGKMAKRATDKAFK